MKAGFMKSVVIVVVIGAALTSLVAGDPVQLEDVQEEELLEFFSDPLYPQEEQFQFVSPFLGMSDSPYVRRLRKSEA